MNARQSVICYAARLDDSDEVAKSRSGGVFMSLCKYVIDRNGIVYGCSGRDPYNIIHKRAENIEECEDFRGSKYVQSIIGNTFRCCLQDLNSDKLVLFSGTGCQIDGLLCYLKASNADTSRLITVDLICHGVPSPKIFHTFLYQNELKNKKKVVGFEFRSKKECGWRAHKEKVLFDDGSFRLGNEWTNMFYSNLILRPACYNCPYTCVDRESDFTLGDYWGIENNAREFDDNKGVNLVIIHSDKGKNVFSALPNLEFKKTNINTSLQPQLEYPSFVNKRKRAEVMKAYKKRSNRYFVHKYFSKFSLFYLEEKIKQKTKSFVPEK